jgi:hypothetical protein
VAISQSIDGDAVIGELVFMHDLQSVLSDLAGCGNLSGLAGNECCYLPAIPNLVAIAYE